MDERATGIILRTYPLTESSLIVHWLTRELGRTATVARGALRPKSSFRGKIDLFHQCELLFARSRRSELHTLKEVALLESYPVLRSDIQCLHRVVYAAALIEQTTETDTPVPELFELLRGYIEAIVGQLTAIAVFAFELKLLETLGMRPDPGAIKTTAGVKRLIEVLLSAEWRTLQSLRLSAAQFQELRQFLHGFLLYHLEKIPRSRSKALEEAEVVQRKTG
jgi:DNA repair protein RecO (recombination protein O)